MQLNCSLRNLAKIKESLRSHMQLNSSLRNLAKFEVSLRCQMQLNSYLLLAESTQSRVTRSQGPNTSPCWWSTTTPSRCNLYQIEEININIHKIVDSFAFAGLKHVKFLLLSSSVKHLHVVRSEDDPHHHDNDDQGLERDDHYNDYQSLERENHYNDEYIKIIRTHSTAWNRWNTWSWTSSTWTTRLLTLSEDCRQTTFTSSYSQLH